MDFLEALNEEAPPLRSGKCKLQRWLDSDEVKSLPGYGNFVAAMANRNGRSEDYRTNSQLLRVVRRMGLHISERTLAEHRRFDCRCAD